MSSFPHQPGLGIFLKASGLVKWDVKGRMAMCLYFSPDPPLSKERICKRGQLLAGCPFVELCSVFVELKCVWGCRLNGEVSLEELIPHSPRFLWLVTQTSPFPQQPTGKESHQLEKGRERRQREYACFYSFVFTEMLAFVQRKTFHISAAWWMKCSRSEKQIRREAALVTCYVCR